MTSSHTASVDADTVARLAELESRRFNDCLERLTLNGIGDTVAAAELVGITHRYEALSMLQRGYLNG